MTFIEYIRYLLLLLFFPRSLKTMEWRMLRFLNKDRKKNRLLPLRMQDDLRDVARKHSKDMARKDYFEHVNMKGQSPADRLNIARVTEVTSGENLAKIGGFGNPTQFAEEGLMNSPGHRANILNPAYNVVGIGIIQDLRKIYYFTQNFAKRDIIFRRRPTEAVKLSKSLRLHGEINRDVTSVICQIHYPGQEKPVSQKIVKIKKAYFDEQIFFPEIGLFDIWLFCEHHHDGRFSLSNKFGVRVKKGFFS